MVNDTNELRRLALQVAEKNRLKGLMASLEKQRDELAGKVRELDRIRYREQADVTRLKSRSLTRFFMQLSGKMDDALRRETEEACAAAVKYDAAKREQDDIVRQIAALRGQLSALSQCEWQYEQTLKKHLEQLKAGNSPRGGQIRQLEQDALRLETQKKEITEAIDAGRTALKHAEAALEQLDKASGLNTWDMLGGGLITDLIKHDALDTAQDLVECVQVSLRRFSTELADVQLEADLNVSVDGFLRFADFFFDGILSSVAVKSRIDRSCEQLSTLCRQIERVLTQLDGMLRTCDRQISGIHSRIKDIAQEN